MHERLLDGIFKMAPGGWGGIECYQDTKRTGPSNFQSEPTVGHVEHKRRRLIARIRRAWINRNPVGEPRIKPLLHFVLVPF